MVGCGQIGNRDVADLRLFGKVEGNMDDIKMNLYVDYINANVLNRIDYIRLQEDYETQERAYAKSVLNALHQGVLEVYGTDYFAWDGSEDSFILLPGVLKSKQSGNLCVALLELDLSASGEHWGTDFLTKYGCVNPRDDKMPQTVRRFLRDTYGDYDYGYTAFLECDIHLNIESRSEDMREMLEDFRDFEFVPCVVEEALQKICDYADDEEMEQ